MGVANQIHTTTELPPGPSRAASALWFRQLGSDPLGTLERMASEYGDIGLLRLGSKGLVIARGAEAAHRVLVSGQEVYAKNSTFQLFRPVLGLGLVTSEGETWRRSRRMVQPLFAKRHLDTYAEHMSAAALSALGRWEREWQERTILLDEQILHVGLDTVGRALMTDDLTVYADEIEGALSGALHEIGGMITSPGVALGERLLRGDAQKAAKLTSPRHWRRLAEHSAESLRIAGGIVDERYSNGHGNRDDLLRLLMESEDPEDGSRLTRQQVIDELRTFIGAGHETTAHGLAWMFHLLAQNPEARERLEREVDEVLGDALPDAQTAGQLEWLTACFQEGMRLYPPAWVIPRIATEDDELAGYRIAKGTGVMVATWTTHRDPSVYRDPLRFDPSRWLGDAATERPRLSYMPFGGGRRMCVGQGFAMLNVQILGGMMVRRYRFERTTTEPVKLAPSITLRPVGGLPMRAHRRVHAQAGAR